METRNPISRRKVLQGAVTALAIPYIIPTSVRGANDRILTGHIGVGNMGRSNLSGFKDNVVAICDVDRNHIAQAAKMVEGWGRSCETYTDYRKLLERKDLDAIVISTPDHWHSIQSIEAMQAGKDVYCEKPLTLTIAEGRKMVQVARRTKRVVQTGSQQRSAKEFRRACELVRSGRIGKLLEIHVGIPGPNHPGKPIPDSEPPAELDYEFWLGPAPYRPYNKNRVHYNFRFFRDYSGGQLTNWGAHHIDIAMWGMDTDDTGPIEVFGTAAYHPEQWHEVTETCRMTHVYANGVKLIVGQKQPDIKIGTTFIGTEGKIHVDRGKLSSDPAEIVNDTSYEPSVKLYVSNDHRRNFLDCVKSRQKPICDVEIGHRSATVCHLSNIVAQTGRSIRWDPKKEQVIGDKEANAMVSRKMRSPWKI